MLELIELANDVGWRAPRDWREGAEAFQPRPVAEIAGHGRSRSAFRECLSLHQAAHRHIGREGGSRVAKFELIDIVRHLDDAPAERLGAALRTLHVKQARRPGFWNRLAFDDL